MHAHMPYMKRESPISKLNEQWTCADELPNVKKIHISGLAQHILRFSTFVIFLYLCVFYFSRWAAHPHTSTARLVLKLGIPFSCTACAHACILSIRKWRRKLHKPHRLSFISVPYRHQATDFYQIKM